MTLTKSVDSIVSMYPQSTVIIRGDYNLPEIIWNNNNDGILFSCSIELHLPHIPECFPKHRFSQVNTVLNSVIIVL